MQNQIDLQLAKVKLLMREAVQNRHLSENCRSLDKTNFENCCREIFDTDPKLAWRILETVEEESNKIMQELHPPSEPLEYDTPEGIMLYLQIDYAWVLVQSIPEPPRLPATDADKKHWIVLDENGDINGD